LLLALFLCLAPLGRAQPDPKATVITVPLGGTKPWQMTTKQPIAKVLNKTGVENIVGIRRLGDDPTSVLLVGIQPGLVQLEFTDDKGKVEVYDVLVQLDVVFLRTQLKAAVPTAAVVVTPVAGNTVILGGTVQHADDVQTILDVARSIGGLNVINAMRVGGVQQVQLDVVIANVSRSEFRRMAFNFLTDSRHFFLGSTVGNVVSEPPLVGLGSSFLTVNGILSGAPGTPNGAPTNLLAGVLHSRWGFLAFLQALRDESMVKLMAEPRVTTLSGRPASFLSGGEQAIPVPAGLGQVGVQFEEFGTRLNVLPIVLGDGKIHLEIEPEVSQLDNASGTSINGTVVPGRVTNRVNTTVILESGQTFVLGGLIQHEVTGTTEKTPIVGDLPFIGAAFSTKSYLETEREVIILVTPHLVDAQDCGQLTKFLPGQETRSPDDFELFLEGILEAPRGPRDVWQGHHYVPAYRNGPTSGVFPCAGNGHGGNGNGGCANGNCANGNCAGSETAVPTAGSGVPTTPTPAVPVMTPAAQRTTIPPASTTPPVSTGVVDPRTQRLPLATTPVWNEMTAPSRPPQPVAADPIESTPRPGSLPPDLIVPSRIPRDQ
jgi:pilus assembly protein CpaC